VAWDAKNHAVVKFGATAESMRFNVVRVKWMNGEVEVAALTFAVSGDEKLTDLPRRKVTA
jgi:hypothetical protein